MEREHQRQGIEALSTFSANAPCELDVLGHNCNTLGVNCTQIGVLKEAHKVSLSSLLKGQDSRRLESEVSLEILGNLANKPLKGQLADEELSAFLIFSDLTKSNSSWAVSVRLLYSTGSRCTLPGSLGCQLLSWSLTTSGLAGSLLGTSHFDQAYASELREVTVGLNVAERKSFLYLFNVMTKSHTLFKKER
jgi:hypothetical protein